MTWFYAVGNEQRGPVSEEEFRRLVAEKIVGADTLVCGEGWDEWCTYGAVMNGATGKKGINLAATELCAMSGRRLLKSEMIQYSGRWVGMEYRDEFFRRRRDGFVFPEEMIYAGFWLRFAAKLIDGALLTAGNLLIGLFSGIVIGLYVKVVSPEENLVAFIAVYMVLIAMNVAFTLGYTVFFTKRYNATPGKMALGLKVLRSDGSKLSTGRIVGRYFAEVATQLSFMIGYLMAAFDKPEFRAMHDRMADTRVVSVR